jgi:hypothetical protein
MLPVDIIVHKRKVSEAKKVSYAEGNPEFGVLYGRR